MSATIWGFVREGKIVPLTPLSDGLQVQITVPEEAIIDEELQAQLDAWSHGNAEALDLIEQLSRGADGVIRVGQTRVTLDTLVAALREGATAEEIVRQYPSLDLTDVSAVIDYYLDHLPEVETYLRQRQAQSEAVRRDNEARFDPAGVRGRLLARRADRKEGPDDSSRRG
ncbi:MAG TPA: DUF433 domain-containing protein [Isosphaeraceae bacterium]|nr:DUF433 domain-containing protein [Isosphaeraceae bacterium]